jgi:hypothetical protein
LQNPKTLQAAAHAEATPTKSRGEQAEVAEQLRGDSGPVAAALHTLKKPVQPDAIRDVAINADEQDETHIPQQKKAQDVYRKNPSYPQAQTLPLAAAGN